MFVQAKNLSQIRSIIFFTTMSILVGLIASKEPSYALVLMFIIMFLFLFLILRINLTFLGMVFFLMLQSTISFNTKLWGVPEVVSTIVNRSDEFLWFFFIFLVLLEKFNFYEWKVSLTGLEIPALLFFCVGITSALVNKISLFWSLIAIVLALKGFFLYWIGKNLDYRREDLVNFYRVFFNFLIVVFIIGLIQYFGVEIPYLPCHERLGVRAAVSIFGQHGVFGFVMASAFSLTIGLYFSTREKKWLFYSIVFFLGIIISSVRRSLVGVIFGLLVVFLNHRKLHIKKEDVLVGLVIIILFLPFFSKRFENIFEETQKEYFSKEQYNARFLLYYGSYKIFLNKPWLGEGPGRYGSYVSVITKSPVYKKYGIYLDRFLTDTYWPYILGEYGLLGVIALLFFLGRFLKNIFELTERISKDLFFHGLSVGFIILFVDCFVESIASQTFQYSLAVFILFGGAGILEKLVEKGTL